jgi:putative membrane protein
LIAVISLAVGCDKHDHDPARVSKFTAPPVPEHVTDATFVTEAVSLSMLIVQASQIVETRQIHAEDKALARQEVEAHTQVINQLQDIAEARSLPFPEAMLPKHQEMFRAVQALGGRDFEEGWHDLMKAAHESAITLYERAAAGVQDEQLKAFASQALPKLREHLKEIESHGHHH